MARVSAMHVLGPPRCVSENKNILDLGVTQFPRDGGKGRHGTHNIVSPKIAKKGAGKFWSECTGLDISYVKYTCDRFSALHEIGF